MGTSSDIEKVPKGYYIDGCLQGGVIKRSRTLRYLAVRDDREQWGLARQPNRGFAKYSSSRWPTPLEAALALKEGGVVFDKEWLNE